MQPYIAKMREISRNVEQELPRYIASFRKHFPDFRCDFPIYFIQSIGAFDGAGRSPGGKYALMFGVDVMARIHGPGAMEAFFHHELFHAYHPQVAKESNAFYWPLWAEGLATYVSARLNPKVEESKLLGRPLDLAQRTRPLLPEILPEIIANLDSTSPELNKKYFQGGPAEQNPPPRMGYYVGYLIAQELGERYSLRELARLQGPKLRDEIRRALQAILKKS
jgi:hypothetical protein